MDMLRHPHFTHSLNQQLHEKIPFSLEFTFSQCVAWFNLRQLNISLMNQQYIHNACYHSLDIFPTLKTVVEINITLTHPLLWCDTESLHTLLYGKRTFADVINACGMLRHLTCPLECNKECKFWLKVDKHILQQLTTIHISPDDNAFCQCRDKWDVITSKMKNKHKTDVFSALKHIAECTTSLTTFSLRLPSFYITQQESNDINNNILITLFRNNTQLRHFSLEECGSDFIAGYAVLQQYFITQQQQLPTQITTTTCVLRELHWSAGACHNTANLALLMHTLTHIPSLQILSVFLRSYCGVFRYCNERQTKHCTYNRTQPTHITLHLYAFNDRYFAHVMYALMFSCVFASVHELFVHDTREHLDIHNTHHHNNVTHNLHTIHITNISSAYTIRPLLQYINNHCVNLANVCVDCSTWRSGEYCALFASHHYPPFTQLQQITLCFHENIYYTQFNAKIITTILKHNKANNNTLQSITLHMPAVELRSPRVWRCINTIVKVKRKINSNTLVVFKALV